LRSGRTIATGWGLLFSDTYYGFFKLLFIGIYLDVVEGKKNQGRHCLDRGYPDPHRIARSDRDGSL